MKKSLILIAGVFLFLTAGVMAIDEFTTEDDSFTFGDINVQGTYLDTETQHTYFACAYGLDGVTGGYEINITDKCANESIIFNPSLSNVGYHEYIAIIEYITRSWDGSEWTTIDEGVDNTYTYEFSIVEPIIIIPNDDFSIENWINNIINNLQNFACNNFGLFCELEDTSWDLSYASYDYIYISTQNISPTGLFFKPDGTKLYYSDDLGDKIYQSSLSTPWDLSTVIYENSIPTKDSDPYSPQDLFFSSDGSSLYEAGYADLEIIQSDCTTPWELSSCIYETTRISMQGSPTYGMFFKSDGSKLYEVGFNSGSSYIYQSTCSTPWDLSSCIYDNIYTSTQNAGSTDLFFKSDGTKLYHSGTVGEDMIYQYSLSTPWDISTAIYDNINLTTQSQGVHGIFFRPDGTGLYEIDISSKKIYQYSL